MRQIYDFGMHVADDTEVYLKKGFRVIAVEANPELCHIARKRFAGEIARNELVILNMAIGDREGSFDFYVCNEHDKLSTASLNVVKAQTRNGVTFRKVEVTFTTADKIMAQYGPARYAKIDIEGHDLICLRQIASGGVPADYVSFEVDFRTYSEGLSACQQMGFTRFALVPQRHIAGTRSPSPSKEGESVDHSFSFG